MQDAQFMIQKPNLLVAAVVGEEDGGTGLSGLAGPPSPDRRAYLMYMRAFAEAWPEPELVQQAVGRLPWGHNFVLLTKLKAPEARLAHALDAARQIA
jgi:hypothetical protein